jgi:hypothetical protein
MKNTSWTQPLAVVIPVSVLQEDKKITMELICSVLQVIRNGVSIFVVTRIGTLF